MKTYSQKLLSPKWQKKRLQILNRDKFTCRLCKDDQTELHVHHLEYHKDCEPWEYENKLLITLCKHCHSEVEDLKNESDFDFNNLKLIKFNNWTTEGVVYFIQYSDHVLMRIYGKNMEFVCGYQFSSNLDKVSQLFKKANLF